MSEIVKNLLDVVRQRESHALIISGNIYDQISFNSQKFPDLFGFFVSLTEKKFPQIVAYDLFSGTRVIRGSEKAIAKAMGIKSEPDPKEKDDDNAKLIAALKKSKMVGQSALPVNPLEAMAAFDQLFRNADSQPTAVVIEYPDALMPAQMANLNVQSSKVLCIAIAKWARDLKIREKGHLVVLLCRRAADLEEMVLDRNFDILQIRCPKPDLADRQSTLETKGFSKELTETISKISSGLSLKELERLSAQINPKARFDEIASEVFFYKQKILRDEYGDVLEIMRPQNGFESIGGLEKPIAKLKKVAESMRQGKTSLAPQGILFMGPPGTGKTVLAEAFAKEAGLNFVKSRDIKSMWVGESERRMSKFLDALKDLEPVVVFIDEFDQNQGQRGGFDGDSGVSRNLFKKMLEVMSDTSLRGKVLWILATNRPDLIDPAMKRPGRCDMRIPFLQPDVKQLALICQAAFRQYPDIRSNIKDWTAYAKKCDGYTGADMVEVVRRAWEHANEKERSAIIAEDMDWACEDYRPQVSDWPQVMRMSLLALVECSSESLMPDNWKEIAGEYIYQLTGQRSKFDDGNEASIMRKILDTPPSAN
ncbi:MAG: ATP-binding protein [Patescibacteria group bacterium]